MTWLMKGNYKKMMKNKNRKKRKEWIKDRK